MSKLLLTRNADSVAVSLDEANVIKAFVKNNITNVVLISEEDGFRKVLEVSEVIASVALMSKVLVAVTDLASAETVYVNKDRVSNVYDENAKAVILLENEGTNLEKLALNEAAAVYNRLVIAKDGEFSFLNDSFTATPNTVVLDAAEGDQTAKFTAGVVFTVFGEGDANDAIFTVVSSAWTTVTTITVTETPIVNATATGYTWVR